MELIERIILNPAWDNIIAAALYDIIHGTVGKLPVKKLVNRLIPIELESDLLDIYNSNSYWRSEKHMSIQTYLQNSFLYICAPKVSFLLPRVAQMYWYTKLDSNVLFIAFWQYPCEMSSQMTLANCISDIVSGRLDLYVCKAGPLNSLAYYKKWKGTVQDYIDQQLKVE